MKVVTFNIRCDYGQDGLNEFANRKELILRKINQEKPDIIGFQEVLPHVAKWLKENLNEYYVIGCGRGANLRDEQMSIAYHRDRINLIIFFYLMGIGLILFTVRSQIAWHFHANLLGICGSLGVRWSKY